MIHLLHWARHEGGHAWLILWSEWAKKKPAGLVFGAVLIFMLFTGIFADRMAPYGMNDLHLDNRLETPSAQFWLGTDQLGRDVLSRLLYGARISVIVSLSATTICVIIAALIGVPSGFLGGKFDVVVQRVVDALMAFPGLLLLITVMSLVGTGALQIILILGFYYGIQNCRVIRSAVIGIKENAYMAAAESIGSPAYRTIAAARNSKYNGADHNYFHYYHRRRHHVRSMAQLPGIRTASRCRKLGRDAQLGWAQIHGVGAGSGNLAGVMPDRCGVLRQHVW